MIYFVSCKVKTSAIIPFPPLYVLNVHTYLTKLQHINILYDNIKLYINV